MKKILQSLIYWIVLVSFLAGMRYVAPSVGQHIGQWVAVTWSDQMTFNAPERDSNIMQSLLLSERDLPKNSTVESTDLSDINSQSGCDFDSGPNYLRESPQQAQIGKTFTYENGDSTYVVISYSTSASNRAAAELKEAPRSIDCTVKSYKSGLIPELAGSGVALSSIKGSVLNSDSLDDYMTGLYLITTLRSSGRTIHADSIMLIGVSEGYAAVYQLAKVGEPISTYDVDQLTTLMGAKMLQLPQSD